MADNRFKIKNGLVVEAGGSEVSGSLNAPSITGSLFGTASWSVNAISASYFSGSIDSAINAQTASFVATASWAQNAVTASYVTGAIFFGNNLALSSSYAITASYALNGGTGGTGNIVIADEGDPKGTATFLNFIGDAVTATVSANTASINISAAQGTGSVTLHTQASPAVTWSFNHKLNNTYPVLNVWDSSGFTLIPGGIKAVDSNNIEIYFSIPQTGYASAVVGGTAISASVSVSSSYALTASYALNSVSSQTFPYTGSAEITGSLILTGSIKISGSVDIGATSVFVQQNPLINIGTQTVAAVPTSSFVAAFFDYFASSGSNGQNRRSGTVMSVWNTLGTVEYTDNSTNDIGNTSGVVLSVVANGSNAELRATVTTNNWNIKALVRSI